MRRINLIFVITITIFLSSCVSMTKFNKVQDQLRNANEEKEHLNQRVNRLQTANIEFASANEQLTNRIKNLNSELEEALYELNIEKQRITSLERNIEGLNRQLELQKTGSTSEIEQLLTELQTARNDLNIREDKLRDAERILEEKNARLIELQDVLAQQEQAVKNLKDKVMKALTGFTSDELTVHEKNGKVYVSMDEKLLFKTGRWDVDPKGQQALRNLSQLLADNKDINIMVEGHTDDVPMRGSGEVKDNWDLSVMRATAVTKILTQNQNLAPERVIAAGRSEYVPLAAEKTPEARQMNRRTEIILTPQLDELLRLIEMN
ncbi:MAG TPA: OmpA family protein [Mariniphaga sp.]|nr:OmpA family protein [Mariniphaga sp.]